ncbi:MAG: hypothetical protein KBS94_03745 [Prevotella sp.]|nr:hypothetical protein [Candidatus Equicola faecalis]
MRIVEYKSNGKEFDRMHGLDTYDYGARQYDPARITWDRMDQFCEKYYHINPYVYCGGNPVKYIDFEGKEKIIALNPVHPENRNLIKAAKSFVDDKNIINIWAHGNNEGMTVDSYNAKTGNWSTCNITNSSQMEHFLQTNSQEFNNLKDGETTIVVLHSCETGADVDKKGHPGFAQDISKGDYQNKTGAKINIAFVAPTENVQAGKLNGKGPIEIGTFKGKSCETPGQWNVYYKGECTNRYKENLSDRVQPGSEIIKIHIHTTFWEWLKQYFRY